MCPFSYSCYSLAYARASKLTTADMYIARARYESQPAVGSSGLNARWAIELKFTLILDSSVGLPAAIQSAGDSVPETTSSIPAFSRGRQLVSFRFEITCLCQSIEINNNKYICPQDGDCRIIWLMVFRRRMYNAPRYVYGITLRSGFLNENQCTIVFYIRVAQIVGKFVTDNQRPLAFRIDDIINNGYATKDFSFTKSIQSIGIIEYKNWGGKKPQGKGNENEN